MKTRCVTRDGQEVAERVAVKASSYLDCEWQLARESLVICAEEETEKVIFLRLSPGTSKGDG